MRDLPCSRLVCCLVMAALAGPDIAVAAEPASEVNELISALRGVDFQTRQRATMELKALGKEAIPALANAAVETDAEVRRRALAILVMQGSSSRADFRRSVREALDELQQSADPRRRQLAQAAFLSIHESASGAAAAELTRLGAILMPVQGSLLTFNVQIGQVWQGGNERLSVLAGLGDVPWLSLESAPVDDDALAHIARLGDEGRGPTRLFLGNSRITGSRLSDLAPLRQMQYLSLKHLSITDRQLAALPDFPDLQYLGLDGTGIGDAGLKSLERFAQLQVLWLDNTRVTDQGLAHLRPLRNLRTLYLPGTQTGGPGLSDLRHLPGLTSLSLKGVQLAPDATKHIGELEQLESLGLDLTNVTDEQLADLEGLTRLRVLWLTGTRVTDAGVNCLHALRGLQIVHLSDTFVSDAGARALERALPNGQVTISNRQTSPQAMPRVPPDPPVRLSP